MFKSLKSNRAQIVTGEYVLVFFMVLAVVTAMTVYFRRAVQARLRGARNAMINTVFNRTGNYFTGGISVEYEPYYANTVSTISRGSDTQIRLLGGETTGISRKTVDDSTVIQTRSETAAPKDTD